MKILRIRDGFATNSSSSHSIIMAKDLEDRDTVGGNFGWNNFIAASEKSKRLYMACQLFSSLKNFIPKKASHEIAEMHTEVKMEGAYIDHQSLFTLPNTHDGKFVNMEFFKDFLNFVLSPEVAIVGGNDNGDYSRLPIGKKINIALPRDNGTFLKARRDPSGFWTVFNTKTGRKTHITFDDNIAAEKSFAPELVDLKITDFCTKGCSYCYQSSSPTGEHADYNFVWEMLGTLGNLEVFEVAIGGGEPVDHPDFIRILDIAHRAGLTPNFSTKKINWLHNPIKRKKILSFIGGFAYSVDKPGQAEYLGKTLKYYDVTKASLQIIPGLMSVYNLESILREAYKYGLSCTLLGVKVSGRGQKALDKFKKYTKSYDETYWLQSIKKLNNKEKIYPTISIDTCLASVSKDLLEIEGISPKRYYTKEGMFSMYIDAVNKTMGPHSFCDKEEMVPSTQPKYSEKRGKIINTREEQIINVFEKF